MEHILILHHDDRDGYTSAALIVDYLEKKYKKEEISIYTREIDYSVLLIDVFEDCVNQMGRHPDHIYILDYSISTIDNCSAILKLARTHDLVWIDHHKSTIEMAEEYPSIEFIEGYRVDGIAGCALTYLWTHDIKPYVDIEKGNENIVSFLKQCGCPPYVLYAHRYDIFDVDEDVLCFNYGNLISSVGEALSYIHMSEEELNKNIIEEGKIIKGYLDKQNRILVESNAIEHTCTFENRELKYLILNHTVFNSLVFGDLINEYDFVCIYALQKNGKWKHSLYTVKDDIDVSRIAKKFDGGGHRKAAGFVSGAPLILQFQLISKNL